MRKRIVTLHAAVAIGLWAHLACAGEGAVLAAMDSAGLRMIGKGGENALVDGKVGKAVKLTYPANCKNVFFTVPFKGSPEWDKLDGFSFWVKGDGSKQLGGLQFIWNDDYAARYDYAFPIDSTEWKKVYVPWTDLIPALAKPSCKLMGTGAGHNPPSKLKAFWIGKWWYWREYGACSFTIDNVQLEPKIDADTTDYTPRGDPLARVLAKLKARKPVTIVTMGDSLTDYKHWANRQVNWPTVLKKTLEQKYGSKVTIVNPAIGGTELRQNLILMPRWLARSPEPDLVTVCFGYNDWSDGMRGPMFLETHKYGVGRIRRMTKGKADVLLITTCPAVSRWDTMAELAQATRDAAKARKAGLADIYKAFHAAGVENKERLYCRDKTHMGAPGHELVAKTVAGAIESGGKP